MPLASLLIVIALISNTTTKTGLKISCGLDRNTYLKGIKVAETVMASLNITRDAFHPRMELQHRAEKKHHGAIVGAVQWPNL